MQDPSQRTTVGPSTRAELCDQIDRMVSALWQRRSGIRPASVNTEYVGDVVRCQIRQGESPPDDDGAEETINSIGSRGYQTEAKAGVERLTERTVRAFIAKGGENESATNAFILEPLRVKH